MARIEEVPPMLSIRRSPSPGSAVMPPRSLSASQHQTSTGRLPVRGLPAPLRGQHRQAMSQRSMSNSLSPERVLLPLSRSSSLMMSSAAIVPAEMVASKRFSPPGGGNSPPTMVRGPPKRLVKVMTGPPPPGMVKVAVSPSTLKSPGLSAQYNLSHGTALSSSPSASLSSPAPLPPPRTEDFARTPSEQASLEEQRHRRRSGSGRKSRGTSGDPRTCKRKKRDGPTPADTVGGCSEVVGAPVGRPRHRRHHRFSRHSAAQELLPTPTGSKDTTGVSPPSKGFSDSDDEIKFVIGDVEGEVSNVEIKGHSWDEHGSFSSSPSVLFQFSDTDPPRLHSKKEESTQIAEERNVGGEVAKSTDAESPRSGSHTHRNNLHRTLTPVSERSKGSKRRKKTKPRAVQASPEKAKDTPTEKVEHEENVEKTPAGDAKEQAATSDAENVTDQSGLMTSTTRERGSGAAGGISTLSPIASEKLTEFSRKHIAEQFLSILCPQQFYGKVTKLHRIRMVNSERSRATGLKEHATILVASKGTLPNQLFYPQLRLVQGDGTEVESGDIPGQLDTSVVLCEAAPGNMVFAGSEAEAENVLEGDPTVTSCFVLEKSAIVFRDPVKYVLPKAMLDVRWIPYSVQGSEPVCPVHRRELQLYDGSAKELRCSLCLSKSGNDLSKFVVVPEALEGDSRRRVTETVSRHLKRGCDNAAQWVARHQRITSMAKHKRQSIIQQFDMLISAVNAKRDEVLEQCDASFASVLSSVAKEILLADEKVALMKAAVDHLRTDTLQPLLSLQVATVANALHVGEEIPWNESIDAVNFTHLNSQLSLNLESVMAELQLVSMAAYTRPPSSRLRVTDEDKGGESTQPGDRQSRRRASEKSVLTKELPLDHHLDLSVSSRRHPLSSGRGRSSTTKGISSARRVAPLLPQEVFEDSDLLRSGRDTENALRLGRWIPVPGCQGTCIFNAPIHKILKTCSEGRNLSTRPIALQWTLRVDDAGDWVGVGVGVGGNLATWSETRTPDLGHLWVVPDSANRQQFNLRVTLAPRVGHAKLTVHSVSGKQLDDGHIPQWRATRSCYPQITFGGRVGDVRLIEGPLLLAM